VRHKKNSSGACNLGSGAVAKKRKEAEALQKKDAEMRKKVAEGRCSYTEKPAGVVSFSFCFYLAFLFDHIILCVLCVSISFCFLILTSNGKK
jgi:hypothetical protein